MDLWELPDSERLSELVPDVSDEMKERRLVIGQDFAMLAMLRVHITCYSRRAQNLQVPPEEVIHPLQEALFTGDGGMFSFAYLAMVERFVLKINAQLGRDPKAERDLTLMAAIAPILYPGDTPREPLEMMRGCLDELRRARFVYVYMSWDRLEDAEENLRQRLSGGVGFRSQIDPWQHKSLRHVLEANPKPVYVDLEGHPGYEDSQEEAFLAIVEVIRTQMAPAKGVYYSFRGRLPFLRDFGMPTRQGRFVRIHLNPLTELQIGELINRSRRDDETMSEYLTRERKPKSLDEIVSDLHHKTEGHAFLVHGNLRRGSGARGDGRHIDWLQDEVRRFPEAIKKYLFFRRNDPDIDLDEVVDLGNGRLGTVGYLATRIHAGIGPYSRSTSITIPASLLKYMEDRFVPLAEYCMESVTRRSNRETLVEVLIRYFQAVFSEKKSWGEAMREFCSRTCLLWDMGLQLDVDWRKNLWRSHPYVLGESLFEPVDHGHVMMYRSAEGSEGPDFFVVDREQKMLVAVKVVSEPFSPTVVDSEARRFRCIQAGFARGIHISLLMLCVFGSVLDDDTESRVWETPDLEILIVNLSRPDLRRKFFEPAIPDNVDHIVSIIEELVSRV